MNRDEFIEVIEGFEDEPFQITYNKEKISPLKYVKALSDSVKVLLNGKPAVYKYSEIEALSFDVTEAPVVQSSTPAQTEQSAPTQSSVNPWKEDIAAAKQYISAASLKLIDRRDEIKANIKGTEISAKWASLDAKFRDAVKNHSLDQKIDNIINSLDVLYDTYPCKELKQQLGMVFAECRDYENAAEEFALGEDYYNAAYCAIAGDDSKTAADNLCKLIVNKVQGYDGLFGTFFSLLLKAKIGKPAVDAVKKTDLFFLPERAVDDIYYGLLLLIDMYKITPVYSPTGSRRKDIPLLLDTLDNFTKNEKSDPPVKVEEVKPAAPVKAKPELYHGYIAAYNHKNTSGWISCAELGDISFSIRQIEDDSLRNAVFLTGGKGAYVSFKLRRDSNGDAADNIKSVDGTDSFFSVTKGVINSCHNIDTNGYSYGIVISNDNSFVFRFFTIIDPILAHCINQNEIDMQGVAVNFIWNEVISKNGKSNRAILKMWLSDEEVAIKNKYNYLTNLDSYAEFLDTKEKLLNPEKSFCPFPYIPLLAGEVKPAAALEAPKKAVSTAAPENKPQGRLPSFKITSLISEGQDYLTIYKDLEKAEECFNTVLENAANDSHIVTAVTNLFTINMRKGTTENVYGLLDKYKKELGRDKYSSLRVQALDKEKRYEELADFLEQHIPKITKHNTKVDRIKKLINCYLKIPNAEKVRESLDIYKKDIDKLSYNNLYISYLELIEDFETSINLLTELMANEYKVEHKLNYIYKLAMIYLKRDDSDKAIFWFENWKKTIAANRSAVMSKLAPSVIINLENGIDRNLSIAYYNSGRVDEAKEIALELIRKNSDDKIAQQILNDDYSLVTPIINETDDYESIGGSSEKISKLVEWMLSRVNYNTVFENQDILKNIKNDKYVGDADLAKNDIDKVIKDLSEKSFSVQSDTYMAMAKILSQFVSIASGIDGISQNKKRLYIGKSLMYKGDERIQQNTGRESSRYYYFTSLIYLEMNKHRKEFSHAFNMLYYSFFLADNELKRYTNDSSFDNRIIYFPPAYSQSIISVKDLIIFTFDVYNTFRLPHEFIRILIDNIYKDEFLRNSFNQYSLSPNDKPAVIENSDDFFKFWKKKSGFYKSITSRLHNNIEQGIQNTSYSDKLRLTIDKISDSIARNCLTDDDNEILRDIIDIFTQFYKLNALTKVDDCEDTIKKIIDLCENVKEAIIETPTAFSYEKLPDSLDRLKDNAVNRLNNLYKESHPVLKVSPAVTAYYEKKQTRTSVTVYIENIGNVQKADISNIQLCGDNNNVEVIGNPVHNIIAVRGGESESYIVNVKFTEDEIKRTSFAIQFSFDYSYLEDTNTTTRKHYSEKFEINLSTKDNFKEIENRFSKNTNTNGVTPDMFYGREDEIVAIVKSLGHPDGSVISHRGIYMYGQKRSGKTSILNNLENSINQTYPGKYLIVNIGSIGGCPGNMLYEWYLKYMLIRKLTDFLEENEREVFKELNSKIDFRNTLQRIENGSEIAFDDALHEIERAFPQRTIMMFVDEFTYIYERIHKGLCQPTFPHFWKALLQNHNICSIVVGQDNMVDFFSNYANDFACMEPFPVSYLKKEEAKKLISNPMEDNGQSRFEEDALDFIFYLTAGSAYLIMIFCDNLVRYMNQKCTSRVTKTTVELFLRDWLFNYEECNNPLVDFNFEPQFCDPCFFEDSATIANDNKVLLTYIAKHCNHNNQIKISDIDCSILLSDKNPDYKNKLIDQLIKRNVISKEGEYCRILVDLIRRYLRKE